MFSFVSPLLVVSERNYLHYGDTRHQEIKLSSVYQQSMMDKVNDLFAYRRTGKVLIKHQARFPCTNRVLKYVESENIVQCTL